MPGRPIRTKQTTLVEPVSIKDGGARVGALTASLTMLNGRHAGAVYEVDEGITTIGRDPSVHIQIVDSGLSRRHARIIGDAGVYSIEDLGSTNGTFLNCVRVTGAEPIASGARIQIGETTVLRFSLQDKLEQEAANRLYELSVRDPLTKLHNRRHLDERLAGEFAYALRHKTALTVLVVDVDHFKRINDTYGHSAGDDVLRALAVVLQNMVRAEDVVARLGGEEFVVLARGIDDRGTEVFAERLRSAVEAMHIQWERNELRVTVSVGVAHGEGRRPYASPAAMVAAADGALYQAKHGGRNQVVVAERE